MPIPDLPGSFLISTAEQCRQMDHDTIETFGIDGFTLMETAGLQAAQRIGRDIGRRAAGHFICGRGNNGGDGLVAARYLVMHYDHRCTVTFPAGLNPLSPDAERNLELLQKMQREGAPVRIEESLDPDRTPASDYLVDGLFGIGLARTLEGEYATAVEWINRQQQPVYALDIPSGLHADTGQIMGVTVKADITLSFGARKLGFYLNEGSRHTGSVDQINLSFPDSVRRSEGVLISEEMEPYLPGIRRVAEHKYSDRVVYVVAGSEGLTGAAIYSARRAWRSGAGAVILLCPASLLPVYEQVLPEIIKIPVGSEADSWFRPEHTGEVLEQLRRKRGVLLIGPGLGNREESLTFAREVLEQYQGKAVIDADALNVVNRVEKPDEATWLLTPHPGEAGRIKGGYFEDDLERLRWVRSVAVDRGIYMISKGAPGITGTPDGECYITGYQTTLFARAGFGDILSGAIAGNLAVTDEEMISILRALLDSYLKARQLQSALDRPIEPNDLL